VSFTPVLAVAASALIAASALAASLDDQIKAVRDRIKLRTPKTLKHKNARTIGETWQGRLEAVRPTRDKAVNALLNAENADRENLFKLLARKNNTTVAKIRHNFAVFRLKRATDHHLFKGRNGLWLTKKEWSKKGPNAPFK